MENLNSLHSKKKNAIAKAFAPSALPVKKKTEDIYAKKEEGTSPISKRFLSRSIVLFKKPLKDFQRGIERR